MNDSIEILLLLLLLLLLLTLLTLTQYLSMTHNGTVLFFISPRSVAQKFVYSRGPLFSYFVVQYSAKQNRS
jgi:hypothetical protein